MVIYGRLTYNFNFQVTIGCLTKLSLWALPNCYSIAHNIHKLKSSIYFLCYLILIILLVFSSTIPLEINILSTTIILLKKHNNPNAR